MPGKTDGGKPATRADLALVRSDLALVQTDLTLVRSDLALVKTDLARAESRLTGDISKLQGDVTKLDEKIDGVESRLDAKIDGVKSELKADINRLAVGLVKTQSDVREIKEAMDTKMATKDDISRVLSAVDGLAKLVQADNRAVVIHGRALTEHTETLHGHEVRLASLEAKP